MTDGIRVRIDGLAEGQTVAVAARQLATVFKRPPEEFEQRLLAAALPLRINANSKASAQRLMQHFERIGLRCALEEDESIENLQAQAEAGDAGSQLKLARLYADRGDGQSDARLALAWASRAARGGNADAQYMLAGIYQRGDGINADPELALAWLRRAASHGHAQAQAALTRMYPRDRAVQPASTAAPTEPDGARSVIGGGTYQPPPRVSSYGFLSNVVLRVLVIGGLLGAGGWIFYSTERQMPSFLVDNIDLIRAEVAQELAVLDPVCIRTRIFPLNDFSSRSCEECPGQAEAGLLDALSVETHTGSGRELTIIRYELTDLGRETYSADRPETPFAADPAFCFGRSQMQDLEWINPIKDPMGGGGWLLGLKYTASIEDPHEFLFDPEAAVLGLPVLTSGQPAIVGPFFTTVVIGLDRKFSGLSRDIGYGRFLIEQRKLQRERDRPGDDAKVPKASAPVSDVAPL